MGDPERDAVSYDLKRIGNIIILRILHVAPCFLEPEDREVHHMFVDGVRVSIMTAIYPQIVMIHADGQPTWSTHLRIFLFGIARSMDSKLSVLEAASVSRAKSYARMIRRVFSQLNMLYRVAF